MAWALNLSFLYQSLELTGREPGNDEVMMITLQFATGHEWHRQAET